MEGRKGLYAVALPFLAHSHFNAFLHLSRMLATKGVTVIYVSLPSNIEILRPRVQGWEDLRIYFEDLSVPESLLSAGRQNVNNISRDMLPLIFDLIQKMPEPLEALMAELTGHEYYESWGLLPPERLVLIYDVYMGCSVSLPSNLGIIRPRVEGWEDLPVYFQDISVPESSLPTGRQNVNNISPDMLPLIFDLIQKMQNPLEALMAELTGREYYESRGLTPPERLVLIYDMYMGCSAAVAAKFGIRSFVFFPASAQLWLCGEAKCWDEGEPLPEIADAASRLHATPDFILTLFDQHMEFTRRLADGILLNSFAELEPKFIRHLERFGAGGRSGDGKPFWAIGPAIDLPGKNKIRRPRDFEIVEWLDRQTPGSVVYVSFGSESYICLTQVIELALGLEASGQPFLWVLRPPDPELSEDSLTAEEWKAEALPDGYERRLGGRCIIECWWAPQAAILAHEATGAFITHCGWNSALESVAAGVPMIALPLVSDQPANALLLVEAKVAVEVKMNDGVAKREEVERAVRKLMAVDEAAEDMKRRVKALSIAAAAAISNEGGAAWKNLDAFVQYSS